MDDLRKLITDAWPALDEPTVTRIIRFHALLCEENQKQNLTRLVSPVEFVEGHLIDVRELLDSGFLTFPAMDLGSGGGVPGLLAAIIRPDAWVLAESEKMKAAFLERTALDLGLKNVRVAAYRGEDWLRSGRAGSIVARAVGKIDKIYGWIGRCSTWNNLIVLKGPGWEAEWEEFGASDHRGKLKSTGRKDYEVGAEKKKRVIIRLERVGGIVPRGTK